jgi:hypothetical protein
VRAGHNLRKKTFSILRIQFRHQLKKPLAIIYILGVIMICALRTPVKYYAFYDRYIVVHTHIFSDKGKILAGQFVLYQLIWAAFVFMVYLLFKFIKSHK